MKDLTSLRASDLVLFLLFFEASIAKDSLSTLTRGTFPVKKTACSSSFLSFILLSQARFKPAKVLPAPGIPVKRMIDFSLFLFELSIISFSRIEVLPRLSEPASFLLMSETPCPL